MSERYEPTGRLNLPRAGLTRLPGIWAEAAPASQPESMTRTLGSEAVAGAINPQGWLGSEAVAAGYQPQD